MIEKIKYWFISRLYKPFFCYECGWEGFIIPEPGQDNVNGIYCPQCSDQT